MKKPPWFWFVLLLSAGVMIYGCKSATEVGSLPTQLFPASTLTPSSLGMLTSTPIPLLSSASPTIAQPKVTPTAQEFSSPETSTPMGIYPAPIQGSGAVPTDSSEQYPLPQDSGSSAVLTSTPTLAADLAQVTALSSATPTYGPTATERFPQPFGLNITPSAGKISIYYSWRNAKAAALMQIIKSFQDYYPDVTFDLTYIPQADLLGRYTQAAYNGAGSELLFGSSDWRASLASQALVEDLSPYISDSFRETFTPVALGTGQVKGAQVCLPYDLRGVVLYRNRTIIPEAPATFDQLVSLSQKVTRVGTLGAYFEGGSYFSLAHLVGLGGQLLDGEGNPLFDRNNYQPALAWIGLLKAMKQAGALELNGDRDLQLFEESKSGFLVEGSWNKDVLTQAVGAGNLFIDPWPVYSMGRLSGFVQSDCLYLNANTRDLSALDHQAALNFIGYFLTSPMQDRLADTGIIPALLEAHPSDPLIRQAMLAFQGGTPYPAELDDVTRQIYFTALDGAVAAVMDQGIDPLSALQTAFDAIQKRMAEIHDGNR